MWEEMSGLDITIAVAMHKQYARALKTPCTYPCT